MLKTMTIFLIFASILLAAETTDKNNKSNIDINKQEKCKQLIASNSSLDELQRSGCCSWHGGVCGCSNGRAACCDGTLSPSCGCN